MSDIQNHRYADLFPMISGGEFEEFKNDISANGLREPIWLYEGQILDGRNRYKACIESGVEPRFNEYSGNDPVSFVISLNLQRRHLDDSQRGIVASKLANMQRGDNQHTAIAATSQEQAAEMLNVSVDTVQRAKKVIDRGSPELVAMVEHGEVAVSTASDISRLPEETQLKIVSNINEGAKPIEAMRAHVANNSGNNEWYTPIKYIQLARSAMGEIDLDPASSEMANKTVGAGTYFTSDDNGLTKTWHGRVWMNPPYAQPLMNEFAEAVSFKYEEGEIEQACILINNATETQWFQRIIKSANAVCFPKKRIRFIDTYGNPGAPLQGQAIIYMGDRIDEFLSAFESEGVVLVHG